MNAKGGQWTLSIAKGRDAKAELDKHWLDGVGQAFAYEVALSSLQLCFCEAYCGSNRMSVNRFLLLTSIAVLTAVASLHRGAVYRG